MLERRLDFDAVHGPVLPWLPTPPARVLDVGSGPGHDAAELARRGYAVLGCEPTDALREGAARLYPQLEWRDAALPSLSSVAGSWDVVWASGMWMHLDAAERSAAMRRITGLLAPGGRWMLSIRHGPDRHGRRIFEVSDDEVRDQAVQAGLVQRLCHHRSAVQPHNREDGVWFSFLVFEGP